MRSGTLATHQIVGMGEAFRIAKLDMEEDNKRIESLRNKFWDAIKDMGFDDSFQRMWNFYLCSCAAAFHSGNCDVTQITIKRPV